MKALKNLFLVAVLCIGTSIFAQTSVPEGYANKMKEKQEKITKDLQLTTQQSETFYKCELERYIMRAEKIKPDMTPEQKTEVRKEITGIIRTKLLAGGFTSELIPKVNAWSVEYDKAQTAK